MTDYPQRVGEPDCRDFLRTGRCKYGESCKYHHPLGGPKATDPNEPPFPIRPTEPVCQYYLKNATCKFGQTCRFHHPPHVLIAKGNNNSIFDPSATGSLQPSNYHFMDNENSFKISNTMSDHNHHNIDSLPQRPGEPNCIYYIRNGSCKFGPRCKYNHPSSESMSASLRQQVNGSAMYSIDISGSDTIQDERDLQSSFGPTSARMNSSGLVSSPRYHHDSIHLGTIDNSFHQYPHVALDMNNVVSSGGNYHNISNAPNSSPKMGSPSMSSTTIASSYDTASFENLPPPRVQVVSGQSTASVMSSPSQGTSSRKNSYSELPKFNLPQVNSAGQLMYNINNVPNSNNNDHQHHHSVKYSNHAIHANINESSRINHLRPPNGKTLQQHHLHRVQSAREVLLHHGSSSNNSIASLSPSSEPSEYISFSNTPHVQGATKQSRNVDDGLDGLTMMTDALLTMIDTQEDGTSQQNKSNYFPNQKHHQLQHQNQYHQSQTQSPNSLPDYLLSENSARSNNNMNLMMDSQTLHHSSHQPLNLRLSEETLSTHLTSHPRMNGQVTMMQSNVPQMSDRRQINQYIDNSSSSRPFTQF